MEIDSTFSIEERRGRVPIGEGVIATIGGAA
jgi:hypothetical protein